MATARAQRKWRHRNHLVKCQLNVMTRRLVHGYLNQIAARFALRGKGEAVTFSAYLARAMMQRAEYGAEVRRMLDGLGTTYHRDRELYSA